MFPCHSRFILSVPIYVPALYTADCMLILCDRANQSIFYSMFYLAVVCIQYLSIVVSLAYGARLWTIDEFRRTILDVL